VHFEILYICIGSEAKTQDPKNRRPRSFIKLVIVLGQVQEATFKILAQSTALLLRFQKLFCSNLDVFWGATHMPIT
jgi:hypothetical protein